MSLNVRPRSTVTVDSSRERTAISRIEVRAFALVGMGAADLLRDDRMLWVDPSVDDRLWTWPALASDTDQRDTTRTRWHRAVIQGHRRHMRWTSSGWPRRRPQNSHQSRHRHSETRVRADHGRAVSSLPVVDGESRFVGMLAGHKVASLARNPLIDRRAGFFFACNPYGARVSRRCSHSAPRALGAHRPRR
jgi:hypothetical protein